MRTLIKKVMALYPTFSRIEISELLGISASTLNSIMTNTRGDQRSLKVKRTNAKLKDAIDELLK